MSKANVPDDMLKCSCSPGFRSDWTFGLFDEVLKQWCFAEDMETFEHGGVETINLLCGDVSFVQLY